MKAPQSILLIKFIACCIFLQSCKKQEEPVSDYFKNISTTRQVIDKPATVQFLNNQFYIVEQNTFDTRLLPCNLAKEFQVNKLLVTVTGDIKGNADLAGGPCCTENFVIINIVR